jgi:hypothetical protein
VGRFNYLQRFAELYGIRATEKLCGHVCSSPKIAHVRGLVPSSTFALQGAIHTVFNFHLCIVVCRCVGLASWVHESSLCIPRLVIHVTEAAAGGVSDVRSIQVGGEQ